MIPVSTAATCRAIDRRLIDEIGVSGLALMELAARGVADVVRAIPEARRGVLVVCGGGNNGGDGYATARWLHSWGFAVQIWAVDPPTGDAAPQRAATDRLRIPIVDAMAPAGVVVDALFGTGLSRPLAGRHLDAVLAMERSSAIKVAVDIPSGLHADTGAVLGACAAMHATVTFGHRKLGFFAEPGATLAGAVTAVDLGQGPVDSDAELLEAHDVARRWPQRRPDDHKGHSGHLVLIAGSLAMAGAAVLAAQGALAAGVGLLTVATPHDALPRLAGLPPAAMWIDLDDVHRVLPRATAVAAGPGLSGGRAVSAPVAAMLTDLWRDAPIPVLFDADAIPFAAGAGAGARVITPHPGEAARALGVDKLESDRFTTARALATDRVALLKGRYTVVAAPGCRLGLNPTNAPTLATGGSGDVLTGLIGALLARISARGPVDARAARDATLVGAWVHGAAGERLAQRGSEGWSAADIAAEIPQVVAALTR